VIAVVPVVSLNVNGIRAAVRRGLVGWMAERRPGRVAIRRQRERVNEEPDDIQKRDQEPERPPHRAAVTHRDDDRRPDRDTDRDDRNQGKKNQPRGCADRSENDDPRSDQRYERDTWIGDTSSLTDYIRRDREPEEEDQQQQDFHRPEIRHAATLSVPVGS
jgi:hypothetical protein